MQSLADALAENYRRHPGFRFEQAAMRIDPASVDRFAAGYDRALGQEAPRARASTDEAARLCLDAMRAVFATLQTQASDAFEHRFLDELLVECERLLDEQLGACRREVAGGADRLRCGTARALATSLVSTRCCFGRLSEAVVAELRGMAAGELQAFRHRVAAGRLTREDLSTNRGATIRRMRDVLEREYARLGVLDALGAYTGRSIHVVGLALELSVPEATWWTNAIPGIARAPHTLYAHLDESVVFPKSIVYLSEVTERNGPTGYYPAAYEALSLNPLQEIIGRVVGIVGTRAESPLHDYYAKQYHQSMSSGNFRRHFMRLPDPLRFNSHLGWDVAPDSALEQALESAEVRMTGPAGTFIAFDGARLLHRGGMVEQGERIALQVVFSDMTATQRAAAALRRAVAWLRGR